MQVRVRFAHGLGDCSNFAHQVPLYLARGYLVEIEPDQDKRVLFEAAGASIVNRTQIRHPWPEAPWDHNKAGWNLCREPMPDLGDVWAEYLAVRLDLDRFVSDGIRKDVCGFLPPCPVVLVALKGNTSQAQKNWPDAEAVALYHALLDAGCSVVVLDWDRRCPVVVHPRFRHIEYDWHRLNLVELYYLMQCSSLLISVDTGSAHFARFTDLPCLALWTKHHPSQYILPRNKTINFVTEASSLTERHRKEWNIIEGKPSDVAQQALRMI